MSKIDKVLKNYSQTLSATEKTCFFTIWQSSPWEASKVFVNHLVIKIRKQNFKKEVQKVLNFFKKGKISSKEDLRSWFSKLQVDSSSVKELPIFHNEPEQVPHELPIFHNEPEQVPHELPIFLPEEGIDINDIPGCSYSAKLAEQNSDQDEEGQEEWGGMMKRKEKRKEHILRDIPKEARWFQVPVKMEQWEKMYDSNLQNRNKLVKGWMEVFISN